MKEMLRRVAPGLIAIALAIGCGEEDGATDAGTTSDATRGVDSGMPGGSGRLELGTGTTAFQEIGGTSPTLDLVHGPQGGWHVDLAVRIYVADPEGMILAYEGRDPATGMVITM